MLVSSDGTEKANGESCLVVSKTSVNGIYIYIYGIANIGEWNWRNWSRRMNDT